MNQVARWMIYTVLAAFGVAVLAFPTARETEYGVVRTPVHEARREQYRWVVKSEALRQIHSREVARETVASLPAASAGAFELVYPPSWAGSDLVAGIRRAASRNLPTVRDTTVRVVVTLVADTGEMVAGVPAIRSNWTTSMDTFMPGAITPNSCVIVVRTTPLKPFDLSRSGFNGAPCYWFGTYGLPGRGVATLLDSTRNRAVAVHEPRGGTRNESYFEYAATYDVRALKCRSGDRSMCELLMIGVPPVREGYIGYSQVIYTPRWHGIGRHFYGAASDFLPGVILSRIERELGSRRFSEVWKSDKPFPAAFADVRGQALGEWIHDFVVRTIQPRNTGPMQASPQWLFLGVMVSGFIAIGALGASKRAGIA